VCVFGGFWRKSGGRTTGVGVQAGNRLCSFLDDSVARLAIELSINIKFVSKMLEILFFK